MSKYIEYRDRLIEQGLCPTCRKPKDREGYYCSECLAKQKERRKKDVEFYVEMGLCRVCGKNKSVPGTTYCEACSERMYEYGRKRYQRDPERVRELNRNSAMKRYYECKAAGICTSCKKNKAVNGKVMCQLCLDKDAQRHALKYDGISLDERAKRGICRFCNEPVKEGYRTCEKHYQMCCQASRIGKEKRNERNRRNKQCS